MNTTSTRVLVEILNENVGRYIVVDSWHPDIQIGTIATSSKLVKLGHGTQWLADCRKPNTSIKIDSILPHYAVDVVDVVDDLTSIDMVDIDDNVSESLIQASEDARESLADKDFSTWQSPDYYISHDLRLVAQTAYRMLQSKPHYPAKILLTGSPGYGKTTALEVMAKFFGLEFVRINTAMITSAEEFLVDRAVINDNGTPITVFRLSEFAQALQRGNAVIVLDELNRVSPDCHNSLFPLLDGAANTSAHGIEITVGTNVVIAATINQGHEFVGTDALDLALMDRFELILEVSALPIDVEIDLLHHMQSTLDRDICSAIVHIANALRDINSACSTRSTLLCAKLVAHGMTIEQSFDYSVVRRIPAGIEHATERKEVLDTINTYNRPYEC